MSSTPAKRRWALGLVLVVLGTIFFAGCEREKSKPYDPDIARRHAEIRGQYQAALVIELGREMVLTHPMSDRVKSARRARILLDSMEHQIVPWPDKAQEHKEPSRD
jgi:hypothetical protein